jgi:hypothetical protein
MHVLAMGSERTRSDRERERERDRMREREFRACVF